MRLPSVLWDCVFTHWTHPPLWRSYRNSFSICKMRAWGVGGAYKADQAAQVPFAVELEEGCPGIQGDFSLQGSLSLLLNSAWQLWLFTYVLFPPRQLQLDVISTYSARTNLVWKGDAWMLCHRKSIEFESRNVAVFKMLTREWLSK